MRKREKRKRKRTDWRKDGRESRLCGRLSVIYIHIDAWEKLATFLRGHRHHSPCPSSTPPSSSFSNGLPSPRAASSSAINTKNSQGQTAPPRFIAYEFSDLSIAATCLSPVTADPHLPSRASVSSSASRSGATYFPGTNAMNHACPRYECSSADIRSGCSVPATIRDFSISCIFTPWFRYVFQKERRCFFCSKTIKSYLFGNGWIFVAAWEENSLISNSLLICVV